MYSIYHFFKNLIENKKHFRKISKLENFPFDESILASKSMGQFPDISIRLNKKDGLLTGGELIELKDSKTYSIASFNSTIPAGCKEISEVIKTPNSIIKKQMELAGDDIMSLPIRQVYYLIRGKKNKNMKVILAHGSFFETISADNLISQSFAMVLQERLKEKGITINDEMESLLINMFSQRENFSKVRNVQKASVTLRFRIMTEVKAEGNILNPKKYPEIKDNSLNLIIPLHNEIDRKLIKQSIDAVFSEKEMRQIDIFDIKHHLNGYFMVLQNRL
jgi:hypothetical protein